MKTEAVMNLINHLSKDDDERQTLWVNYLESGRDVSLFVDHLAAIRQKYSEEELLQITVWKHISNPSDLNLQFLFDNFSLLEQSVIQLLILGATLQQIGSIKDIGLGRLRHIISIIAESECWEQFDAED